MFHGTEVVPELIETTTSTVYIVSLPGDFEGVVCILLLEESTSQRWLLILDLLSAPSSDR